MASALIGYTGFVGSNLAQQYAFDYLYNSKNIEEIKDKNFELLVCAAAPGTKWLANKEPEKDWAVIAKLMANLQQAAVKKFILISTIDVYPSVNGVDEDTIINNTGLSPYGKHRHALEEFVKENFDALIIRLPALFGKGLKKNPLFDLMQNSLQFINGSSVLQFYSLDSLWNDIGKALKNNLTLLNIATEPITLIEIAKEIFNLDLTNQANGAAVFYDMHSKHSGLWGNTKPYLYLKEQIITDIKLFTQNFSKQTTLS